MKHNLKITAVLLLMFLVSQLIGLAVINSYSPKSQLIYNQTTQSYENITTVHELPFGFQTPQPQTNADFWAILPQIIISFVIAIALIFILMTVKIKFIYACIVFFVLGLIAGLINLYGMGNFSASSIITTIISSLILSVILAYLVTRKNLFLKLWFFFVVALALGITLSSILIYFNLSPYYALILAVPLAFLKIFKRNFIVHNLTELFIYPGIATVFVPILGIWTAVILLILISIYDIYAVWHSGFMQRMAKFQINKLKIFAGFFIPYLGSKERKEIKFLKDKYKNNIPSRVLKKKKIKVNLAILGGGDVVFPMILAGVVLRNMGLLQALSITLFATLSLLFLFLFARKGKFYPAMPFLTAGCLIGLLVAWLI